MERLILIPIILSLLISSVSTGSIEVKEPETLSETVITDAEFDYPTISLDDFDSTAVYDYPQPYPVDSLVYFNLMETGFHRHDCKCLNTATHIEIATREDAITLGLKPCRECNP